jgi:hypothetical protein
MMPRIERMGGAAALARVARAHSHGGEKKGEELSSREERCHGEYGAGAGRSASFARRMPRGEQVAPNGEIPGKTAEICSLADFVRNATWPKSNISDAQMRHDFNRRAHVPSRATAGPIVVRGATAVAWSAVVGQTGRHSLPQPIHRTARRSLRARNRLLFSQTDRTVSAKNHLGPPQ